MSHNKHVIDGINKDVSFWPGCSIYDSLAEYRYMTEGWKPYNPDPVVMVHDNVRVVRDDFIVGTKARAADLLASRVKQGTLVYCQPRLGLAGVGLLDAAKHHGKDVVLFMPACERISMHQACCIERGAKPVFERIAAMPNLNLYASEWVKSNHDSFFIPLGLKHRLATAAIIDSALKIDPPEECYVATSTGVLLRALQIAWPQTEFYAVCVARNMQAGELGRVWKVYSDLLPFGRDEVKENLPPFPTVPNYDGKVWKWIPKDGKRDRLFWNVGKDPVLLDETLYDLVESNVPWRKDLNR
jgi:hypothetical protein